MRKVFTEQVVSAVDSLTTDIAIASAAVVYTRSFKLAFGDYFAVSYKATSDSGSPSLKIELQQSWDVPTTEGSTDGNWVESENMADIETDLTTETMHHKALTPATLAYGRFKITGSGTNPADTVINIYVHKQEEF